MKIADFFAEIGFKVNLNSLRKFNDGMASVVGNVKTLALSLTGAMTAWEMLQTKIGRGSQSVLNFKTYTGESIQEVQKLAAVMQGTNLNFSMDVLLNDISTVKTRLRELQLFGEGSSMAQALRLTGISGLKPGALDTIQDFLKMLRQIPDAATRTMLAERMGLSKQFLNILDLTDEQYEKLTQLAPKIFPSEEEMRRRQKASLDIYLVWLELVNLFETKVTDFAPILLRILEQIKDLLSDSKKLKLVVEGFKWTAIILGVTMIASALGNIVSALKGIIWLAPLALAALTWKGGEKLGSKIDEMLGIDEESTAGKVIKKTTGVASVGLTAAGIYGAKRFANKRAAAAVAAAERQAARRAMRRAGVRTAAKVGSKIAAKHVAASGANLAPWILAALVVSDLFDIGKGIYDITKANSPVDSAQVSDLEEIPSTAIASSNGTIPNLPQLPNARPSMRSNYNWSSTLASMTINAQNVYLNASRVISNIPTTTQPTGNVENNVARSNINLAGNW